MVMVIMDMEVMAVMVVVSMIIHQVHIGNVVLKQVY